VRGEDGGYVLGRDAVQVQLNLARLRALTGLPGQ
jgi:hypothetical protein